MEWNRIEEKWNAMALRLQSAKGLGPAPRQVASQVTGEAIGVASVAPTGDTDASDQSGPV
jgi:hypothetical protein